jgi:hypothetical protein
MRGIVFLLVFSAGATIAAPIPKALKKPDQNLDFEGYWEEITCNINGENYSASTDRFWKIEKDCLYYRLPTADAGKSTNKNNLAPDKDSVNLFLLQGHTRMRMEIQDEKLSIVFANQDKDKLDNCEPGLTRTVFTFQRVK